MNYLDRLEFAKRLTPGTYRLTAIVKNPHPDRRMRHDWRTLPEFTGGSYFTVSDDPYRDGGVVIRKQGAYSHQAANVDHSLFAALAPYLERVEETPADLLHRRGWAHLGTDVLDVLYKQGLVTLEQVNKALDVCLGQEDDRHGT